MLFYDELFELFFKLFVADPFFVWGVFGLFESCLWVSGFCGLVARLQTFSLFCINRSHSSIVLSDDFSVF